MVSSFRGLEEFYIQRTCGAVNFSPVNGSIGRGRGKQLPSILDIRLPKEVTQRLNRLTRGRGRAQTLRDSSDIFTSKPPIPAPVKELKEEQVNFKANVERSSEPYSEGDVFHSPFARSSTSPNNEPQTLWASFGETAKTTSSPIPNIQSIKDFPALRSLDEGNKPKQERLSGSKHNHKLKGIDEDHPHENKSITVNQRPSMVNSAKQSQPVVTQRGRSKKPLDTLMSQSNPRKNKSMECQLVEQDHREDVSLTSAELFNGRTVCMKNLPAKITSSDISDVVSPCGRVENVCITLSIADGLNSLSADIRMADADSAEYVVSILHDAEHRFPDVGPHEPLTCSIYGTE